MRQKFQNLTLDFRQLKSVPMQDRVQMARSSDASSIFGNLSPTEIAKLFPRYYQSNDSAVASLLGKNLSTPPSNTGGGNPSASQANKPGTTQSTAQQSTPKSVVDLITEAASVKTGGDPGKRGVLGYAQNKSLTSRKKALLDAIATDSGGGYGTINYLGAQFIGNETTDFSKHPFQGANRGLTKYRASGRYQITLDNYEKYARRLGLHNEETQTSDFSPTAQDLIAFEMAKEVYKSETRGRDLETDLNDPNINPQQLLEPLGRESGWHIMKTQEGLSRAANVFSEHLGHYQAEEDQSAAPATAENPHNQNGTDTGMITLPHGDNAGQNQKDAEPTARITAETIGSLEGLDPRLIEYAKTLNGADRERFYEGLNKLGNVDEINKASKEGLDRIGNYTPQETAVPTSGSELGFFKYKDTSEQFGITGSAAQRGVQEVDPRMIEIAKVAASEFPLRVRLFSGKRDKGAHGEGKAVDTQIFDESGEPIASYQTPQTSNVYRLWAEKMREVQQRLHPELNEEFVWGGSFAGMEQGTYGAADWMDFRIGRHNGVTTEGMKAYQFGQGWQPGYENYVENDFLGIGTRPVTADDYAKLQGFRLTDDQRRIQQERAQQGGFGAGLLGHGNIGERQLASGEYVSPDASSQPTVAQSPHTEGTVDTALTTLPTAAPAPEANTPAPAMALGGFIPEKDNLEVKNEQGETVAKINQGEIDSVKSEGTGVRVESNKQRKADDLVNKYEGNQSAKTDTPEQQQEKQKTQPTSQASMTSPVDTPNAGDRMAYIPYQTPSEVIHSSLFRAYNLNRNRTGFGGV